MGTVMNANELRRTFTGFFVERGHAPVPSSGLIPHHPRAPLFTNAGMNQFLPVILGEEAPAHLRATSVQKCVRIRGKQDDIENVGRTTRHLTFFEMLGNFSLGDYFKERAIPLAWELLTEVLGLDGDRLWATVYLDDDEAAGIWADSVGLPAERIQRMGEDTLAMLPFPVLNETITGHVLGTRAPAAGNSSANNNAPIAAAGAMAKLRYRIPRAAHPQGRRDPGRCRVHAR